MAEETPQVRTKLAQTLWNTLQNRKVIDISHYNALLGVYVENDHSFSLEEILLDMVSKELTPNRLVANDV